MNTGANEIQLVNPTSRSRVNLDSKLTQYDPAGLLNKGDSATSANIPSCSSLLLNVPQMHTFDDKTGENSILFQQSKSVKSTLVVFGQL